MTLEDLCREHRAKGYFATDNPNVVGLRQGRLVVWYRRNEHGEYLLTGKTSPCFGTARTRMYERYVRLKEREARQ